MTVEIYGVRDTIKELKALDQGLRWQAINEIKAAAEPLRAAIESAVPQTAPLSGWNHKGRTGWGRRGGTKVVTKFGGRARRNRDTWPLVRIVLQGAAVSMYDMAGRGSAGDTEQGMAFIDGLDAVTGKPSRAAWPAAERRLPDVQAAVLEAVKKVQARVNANLVTRGGR